VQARIPAGVTDGQTIRLKGRGSPGRNGGPAGDLLVDIKVMPHRLFGRSGNNLTVKVPVTFAEAALGGDIDVPTLDGQRVTLRIKPGTQSGSRHRVRGKGISSTKKSGTATGDLIVTVEVDVPTELTDGEREAIEKLAAATSVSPRSDM
jgi:molecular chaperone DnaJ